jgi:hypothetical protein
LLGAVGRFDRTRYRFRRTTDPLDSRTFAQSFFGMRGEPFAHGRLIVQTELPGSDAAVLRDVWQPVRKQGKYFAIQGRTGSRSSPPLRPEGAIGILHIMEDVIEGERGLAIRFGPDTQLFAAELERRLPDLRFVVLQLPTRADTRRFPHDRVQAARARTFAAELFEAGVPAVLVLPSLTAALARAALAPVIEAIAKRPGDGTHALMVAVRKSQEIIARGIERATVKKMTAAPVPVEDAALETPFDVCLYCRANLSLRVTREVKA